MSDIESHIVRLTLPSSEMTILAADTNTVGAINPGEFLEPEHIPRIENIIRHVHPAVEAGDNFHLSWSREQGSSGLFSWTARTNTGEKMPVGKGRRERRNSILFGDLKAVGVGNYIIEKARADYGLLMLNLRLMIGYGLEKASPEMARPYRAIFYAPDSLAPLQFSLGIPHRWWLLTTHTNRVIWTNERALKEVVRSRQKKLW